MSEVAHHNGVEVQPVAGSSGPEGVSNDWFYQLAWPVRELPATQNRGDGSWLVLADPDVGTDLGQLLGTNSRVLAPSVLEEGGDSAGLRDALTRCRLCGLCAIDAVPPRYHRGLPPVQRGAAAGGVARRDDVRPKLPPKLFVVTRNAQPIDEGDRANPAHAVLWGQGRTLALEHPEFWGGIIDVDDSVPAELIAQYLHAEVDTGDGDDQVVYQGGVRHVPRLERRPMPAVSLTRLESDTSHLVIGATGNVGPYLIRQLAEMGAATIVAVSRRGGPQLEELATELSSGGTTLVEVAADAADEAAMTALFERFGKDLPPLEGIYLAALAGGEALLSEMTDDDVNTMFRSKLDVASVLHKLSLKTPVRRFVLFSSITGILGSRWLGHYTAANTFLDTFAYARRALGLAATVVDWGLWKSWADAQPGDEGRRTATDAQRRRHPDVACGAQSGRRGPVRGGGRRLESARRRLSHAGIATRGGSSAGRRRRRRTEHRRCARARARHAARRAGHHHGARTPVAGATGARRQAVSGRRTGSAVWRWFRYRFCCRHFRPRRHNVAPRQLATSGSSTRSSPTSSG